MIFIVTLIISIKKISSWQNDNEKTKETKEKIIENNIIVEENNVVKVDFESLKKINNDIIGYIKVYGTNIDNVFVKHTDNSFYLNHSFDKTYNDAGWIFANYKNNFDGNDRNITLFAHARLDGSMFGTLKKTLKEDWQNNNDNLIIDFITENEESKYQVFSTYRIKVEDYYIESDFNNDSEFLSFINTLKQRSNKDYGVEVNSTDKILTLSTCDINNNYRIVLHAKKLI